MNGPPRATRAILLRLATRRGISLLDTLIARGTGQSRWRIGSSGRLIGTLVYWLVLLTFIAAATQTLGLQTFTDWLARLLEQLPSLAAGLLIVVVGCLLSGFAAELVRAAAANLPVNQRAALARLAQGATLMIALLVGADQIGLKVTWNRDPGDGAGGYGGRRARHRGQPGLAQLCRQPDRCALPAPGAAARPAGAGCAHEGLIVDLTATSLVLETADGRVLLPGRVYHDEAIVLIARHDAG